MNDALYQLLFRLVTKGPQPVTNCVSITAISEALKLDLISVTPVEDVDWYKVTSGGIQTLLDAYDKRPDPEEQIFGAIYIQHAEICGEGKLDGKPLQILGGAMFWCQEHMLGKTLRWSQCFGAYDYATFDYFDPEGRSHLLKPGDWLILSEDGNHRVHQFYRDDEE